MVLIERLQSALGPDYEVERELAGGGMGIVFLARQLRLNWRVAIKVLRPELATAIAAERFQAEGRALAALDHPNVVRVHDAREADGLLYIVMEFVEGETLAARLERGPLPPEDLFRLAGDLLAALGAAHSKNIVHRDVKPANIFLRRGRAVLGDFGIAHWRESADPRYTTPGQRIGTLKYMSPEQLTGEPATTFTDVYAAGLVLYEACTGVHWPAYQTPEQGEWRGVPPSLEAPIRRALALTPEDRWPDGKAFELAIAPRKRPRLRPVIAVGAALIAIVALFRLLRPFHQDAPVGTTMTLAIQPFQVLGSGMDAWLGDSVAAAVREELAGFVDFFVPPVVSSNDSLAVRVTGTAEATGDRLRLTLTADPRRPAARLIADSLSGNKLDWRRLADSLAFRLVQNLFLQGSADDHWLPRGAMPQGSLGLARWLQAEQYFSRANWDEASRAYQLAEQTDPSCYLCSFRLLDIDRWLPLESDSTRIRRLEKAIDRFPRHYQSLIHAAAARLPERLDTLKQAAGDYPGFFLAPFEYGDELFHRGPLYGISRSEARAQFEQALGLRPHFGPGWEHLAWLQLSEGDSASVAAALGSLDKSPATGFSESLRVMLLLGQVWKFSPLPFARETSRRVLLDPDIVANPDAAAGARLLMTTDAPLGAVEFGRMLAATGWAGRSDAVRGGLLGQLFGFAALGQLDSMRAVGRRLDGVTTDGSLPLLACELEAVLRTFDPDTAFRNDAGVTRTLRTYASAGPTEPVRQRAAWMLGILAARAGDTADVQATRRLLVRAPASGRMLRILDAVVRRAHERPARALAALPPMPSIGVMPGADDDPLEDAVLRLSKAEWQEQSGDTAGALSTLLWHEHLWVIDHLTGDPQPGELGWAVGTLARWHRVLLFGPATSVATRCVDLKAIQRRWKHGQPPFAARADSAAALARGVCQ